jgi:cobyric acid synthase
MDKGRHPGLLLSEGINLNDTLQGKCLMVQGVASGVGKSLLATALCRILVQDGLRVAPFKAWNMALNSYTTVCGLEIGWAQGIQAEAAGIIATGHMNPFLLRPRGGGQTEIMIRGELQKGDAKEIMDSLPDGPWPLILASLEHLRKGFDVVIIEGAGSPAEINLKDRDLANMGVARLAKAPVLLTADIDRGGALAALVGSLALLDSEENMRIAGFVINKFRGDFDILRPGLNVVENMTGKPILGVIPHIPHLSLGEEDSVGSPETDARAKGRAFNLPANELNTADAKARDDELDRVAAVVRASLDMGKIYDLIAKDTKVWGNGRALIGTLGSRFEVDEYGQGNKTPRGRTLMVQGCASSVGKSFITAALCRLFAEDGWRVAPFKAQNMGSSSFFTAEGKEINAVQAVQAKVTGVTPSPDMNPIFQKPITDTVAEVIVLGESLGNMTVQEYFHFKRTEGKAIVAGALKRLKEQYDLIILEGGGSPAEVNLREHDLVNMGAAVLADAPVILVGDIDRGGVFAHLTGTMLLLTEEERSRVKAVLINKFRGDLSLLEPGLAMLEEKISRPVLGVVPYMDGLCLPFGAELDVTSDDGSYAMAETFLEPWQRAYEKLARQVRASISMDLLYDVAGLPGPKHT